MWNCHQKSKATGNSFAPCVGVVSLMFALFGVNSGSAQAQVITEFSSSPKEEANMPSGIVSGPDGNLWFTEKNGEGIGKITPTGVVTEYRDGISKNAGLGTGAHTITVGPDGNLWFVEFNKIGKISPSGVITEYSDGIYADPDQRSNLVSITTGPDGNIWFTETNRIGKITPAGVVTEYKRPDDRFPTGITADPDGNVWFKERKVDKETRIGTSWVGKITPTGIVTEYNSISEMSKMGGGIKIPICQHLWSRRCGRK